MKKYKSNVKNYLNYWVVSSILIILMIFGLNYLVDPLWHNEGNKITKNNFAYNERISKTNYFINHMDEYDCVLFGSSVSIVFDTSLIENSRCFNFSVSAGGISEYIVYLRYLSKLGFKPKKILTEINFGFVKPSHDISRLPDFIINMDNPTAVIKSYTSISSFIFSVKNLLHISSYQHMYDENFIARVRMDLTFPFEPKKEDLYLSPAEPPSEEVIELYRELVEMYPESLHIGYVYPQSPWVTSRYYTHDYLETNLSIILQLSSLFDELYDFSFPVEYIKNDEITYDGSHFYEFVFMEIANTLNNKKGIIGIRVNENQHYKEDYTQSIQNFINSNL